MSKPTFPQMEHFFRLVDEGTITSANFQGFLQSPGRFLADFLISYDQSLGLVALIERALGPTNSGHINRDITPERFPLTGIGVQSVQCRVEPYLDNETSEEAAARLTAAGIKLASTGDLAGFLHDHPKEVEKWTWVLAISEDSRWASPDGGVSVPSALMLGASRSFGLRVFRRQLGSYCGVLVLCE